MSQTWFYKITEDDDGNDMAIVEIPVELLDKYMHERILQQLRVFIDEQDPLDVEWGGMRLFIAYPGAGMVETPDVVTRRALDAFDQYLMIQKNFFSRSPRRAQEVES